MTNEITNQNTVLLPADAVRNVNGQLVTTSLKVAEVFGKQHKHILRDVKSLGCSDFFHESNFGPTQIEVNAGLGRTRQSPAYNITKDGLTLLVMGYTGKTAMQFKEAYINEFNRLKKAEQENNKVMLEAVQKLAEQQILTIGHVTKLTEQNIAIVNRIEQLEQQTNNSKGKKHLPSFTAYDKELADRVYTTLKDKLDTLQKNNPTMINKDDRLFICSDALYQMIGDVINDLPRQTIQKVREFAKAKILKGFEPGIRRYPHNGPKRFSGIMWDLHNKGGVAKILRINKLDKSISITLL